MPRIVFEDLDQMLDWASDHVSADKYELYITSHGELIFKPTKSTKTLDYGYLYSPELDPVEILNKIMEKIPKIRVNKIKDYDWATDRMLGSERRRE